MQNLSWPKAVKFGLEVIWPTLAAITLVCFLCNESKAAPFTVAFKPLRTGPAILEAAWQGENVIDLAQTLRIAKSNGYWREVGTMSAFTGPRPTVRDVWLFSAVFGLAHYGVSQLLENAEAPRALALWQVTSLGYKSWNMQRNAHLGLGY